ncbi:MAG: glycoside hydrolase family 3 C-terminal domain-containing protein [Lachnospiraceae bacterium]|nr:glycoside hydrolase family 3 C-terminal domain-containing protein [Lachnospiraceae bacterium]
MKRAEIIKELSLEEKAVLLTGKSVWETRDLPKHNIPSIFLSDGPHGIRKQAEEGDHLGINESKPATCFPTAATVANSWDTAIAQKIGEALGDEASALGANVVLGPGLNIKRNPLCGRNFEYFSEDPYLSGKMAAGYVRGIQSRGVAACPKHFAVNSQELRRMASDSVIDERTLREIYLTGFEIAVKEGKAKTIMSSYNRVNGTYANENVHLLKDILRDEWGFDGVVVTDWGGSNDHVEGVKAGSILEMPAAGLSSAREIVAAVKSGRLSEEVLDKVVGDLVDYVLTLKETERKNVVLDAKGHHALAKQVAEQSAVLLKNDENILPVKKETKVAIIGDMAKNPRYQGAGSSMVNPACEVSNLLDAFEAAGGDLVGFAKGYRRDGLADEALVKEACELAAKADLVILNFGLCEISESEGMDRRNMKIEKNQIDLINALSKANPNLVGVISAGATIEMEWENNFKALLHSYLSGQAGGEAMADILLGKVTPSGKLSETVPYTYEEVPTAAYFPSKERNAEYREGLFVGYRYYDTANKKVKYPFGFGLSYTQFEYSNLKVTKAGVSFTLRNAGTVDGAEVSQLYVGLENSAIYRAKKELKGFAKTFLKAGEEKTVEIPFDDKTFRYWDTEKNSWETEGGAYSIMVGKNVEDIVLSASFEVEGTTVPKDLRNVLPSYYTGNITNIEDSEYEKLLGREIPSGKWSGKLGPNDALCQMYYAKGLVARFAYKILANMLAKSEKKGQPDLNILFVFNMPFRGIAKMTGGAISMDMVDGMLTAVNGHFFRGIGKVIGGFFSNRKKDKAFLKELGL